jgi:diguanylate cyclase (GGDEF)-like protein
MAVTAEGPRAKRPVRPAVLVLLAVLVALCSLRAQALGQPEMLFAPLGNDEGLSPGAINSIAQDAQGFLWFGTEDGLDRFDGYQLRHFIHGHGDDGSLPNNWISALVRDASGRLWVGSDGGGLVWRDALLGRFRPADPNQHIRALHVDRSGRLWMATRGAGVRVLDAAQNTTQEFRHDPGNPNSLSDDSVFAVAEDSSGKIWLGTAGGLDLLDPATGRLEQFGARLHDAAGLPADAAVKVNALYDDVRGVLWIGLDSGLIKFDEAASVFTMLPHREGDPAALPDGRITALLEDDEQRLWVGTTAGLALLDRRTNKFAVLRHDPTNRSSLPDSNITSLYQDRSGLLWIGTKTGGVASWNPRSWSFGHHRFADVGTDSVTSFAVDGRGTLWVGSFGAGAESIDPLTGTVKRYRRSAKAPLALHDDTIMALVTDDRNRAWLGTMDNGIERIDPERGVITYFNHVPEDPASLPAAGVMSLLRDTRGRIWVGTFGGGLAMIDPDTDRVIRYAHGGGEATALSGDRATALAEDRTGLIWIGTDGGGLNVLDPATGLFAHFTHDPNDPASLSANTVYAVHVDNKGSIWVGTRGGGLDHVHGAPFGHDRLRFENLSESEGLPNSTVYGIESDASGRIWVSTNRGLAAVQPGDRSVRSFRRSHGLQGDEFNFGAHYRAPDGTLYFGGANGYNAFLPERLQLNDKPPPVVLTDVLKNNTRVSQTPEMLSRLDLGFRDAVVTFQFSALDFTGPAENRYAYRLDGFDTDWVNAGAARQATYTNLSGGDYVFRVRAANSDGRWNETPLALTVRVAPPPWATWWARTLYGLGFAAILFFVWFGQHQRVRREAAYARRLKDEVDARTAELAERNRDMERANEQLREASVSDSLTGLGNRRYLHDAMDALLRKPSGADGVPTRFVLMVIDLDYLKPINDEYGHEGGDAVLVQVAEILRREFRSADLIVRWGGDEFVVLCLDADLAMASTLAERVRSSVAKRIFRVGEGLVARTSCSIGFAPSPFIPGAAQQFDWEQSLAIADVALYEAKRNRNSWVGWGGTEKAAELPSIPAALSADPAALEKDGFLVVRRRPWNPEETVDQLRAPRRPGN